MSSQRVAVTGASGFIGAAVVRALVARGDDVRALCGPPNDPAPEPPGAGIAVRADICDRAALAALFDGASCVIHLAGPPSVRASFDDPPQWARAHTEGTAAVLSACRDTGIERIVFASSAEVYGRPRTDPVFESHPLEARSPYGAAKIGAEQMVRAFGHAYGLVATIVRPFSVYGPGMGDHSLIAAIVRQLRGDGAIRLADLRPERDYCYVDDVARAIVLAAGVSAAGVCAVNVGSGTGISVGDLAQRLVTLSGTAHEIVEDAGDRRPGNSDILRLVADRNLAARHLGWTPAIDLDEGLRRVLAHSGA